MKLKQDRRVIIPPLPRMRPATTFYLNFLCQTNSMNTTSLSVFLQFGLLLESVDSMQIQACVFRVSVRAECFQQTVLLYFGLDQAIPKPIQHHFESCASRVAQPPVICDKQNHRRKCPGQHHCCYPNIERRSRIPRRHTSLSQHTLKREPHLLAAVLCRRPRRKCPDALPIAVV